jgi:hypothetical protein
VATIQTTQRTHFYKSMTTYGVIAFGKMCIMCLRRRGRFMWKFTADVVTNLERQFNLATGFTKKDDLPVRLKTELAKTGPAKGMVNGVEKMPPRVLRSPRLDTRGRADQGNAGASRAVTTADSTERVRRSLPLPSPRLFVFAVPMKGTGA